MSIFGGRQGNYQWLEETQNLCLGDLIEHCPQVLLGRYLVIATYDSGPFRPNAVERHAGWTDRDGLAYSPRLTSVADLPCDQYDEWHLFAQPTTIEHLERFVNWGGFSLRDPQHLLDESAPNTDRADRQALVDFRRDLLDRFWSQIERVAPESYIADGDHFIFVSAAPLAYASVEEWTRRSRPPEPHQLRSE